MKFKEWAALNNANMEDTFNAGYNECLTNKDTREDPRDVIIARQAIEIERYKQEMKQFFEASRAARDSMHAALGELDKLRFNFY